MAKTARLAAALILLASPVYAQEPTPLKLPEAYRPLAARLSDYEVVAATTLRARDAWESEHRTDALIEMGCEAAVTMGTVEITKRLVGRLRPDGSDHHSLPSGHTAFAQAMGGWRWAVPVAIKRQMAWKHYFTDTVFGFLTAYAATQVCR